MNISRLIFAVALATGTLAAHLAVAQQPVVPPPTNPRGVDVPAVDTQSDGERVSIFGAETEEVDREDYQAYRTPKTVEELRQARGMYRARQRMARLEYNLWLGREPLRPKFNAVPMMSSRYAPRRVYVPVYVRP